MHLASSKETICRDFQYHTAGVDLQSRTHEINSREIVDGIMLTVPLFSWDRFDRFDPFLQKSSRTAGTSST